MTTHVTVYHAEQSRREELISSLQKHLPDSYQVDDKADADSRYLVAWGPPKSLFEQAPNLKAAFSLGAGVDHLLKADGLPSDLDIYRIEDAGMGIQMAQYCRHEVEHFRLLNWRYQLQQQNQEWTEQTARQPDEITVGILGFGVLGQQVAQMLVGDGYHVAAYRRSGNNETVDQVNVFAGQDQFNAFLNASEVLILLAPATAGTHHIINKDSLAQLPKGGWLINVARGELINDEDLMAALRSEHLAGATLDVFHTEPLPADHPFWTHSTLRITPHVAAVTRTDPSMQQIVKNILALEAGSQPTGRVDRNRGY